MSHPHPHPLNVIGDFYVIDGCCTACGVPDVEAPELFGWEDDHCYVRKQPVGVEELARMVNTIAAAELRCIRYRGRAPEVLQALRDCGEIDQCDFADGGSTR